MTYHPPLETPLDEISFCVVDTETTGGRAEGNRVIDIAVFRMEQGTVVEKYQTLLNPGCSIPPWISNLTGIDDYMVRNAPTFSEVQHEIHAILKKGVFAAHNAPFDYSFVHHEFLREDVAFDRPSLCTVRLARRLYPELLSRSLGVLCESLLIDIVDRHRAGGDAEATATVLKEMLRVLNIRHGVKTWGDLKQFETTGPLLLPKSISAETFQSLPEESGTYAFRDAEGRVLAQGTVMNLKRRMVTYFKSTNTSEKSITLRANAASFVYQTDRQPSMKSTPAILV